MKLSKRRARFGAAFLALSLGSIAHAQCLDWGSGFAPLGINGEGVGGLEVFDSGSGAELFAIGTFESAGTVRAANIARWDGSAWSPVGSGITGLGPSPNALLAYDDGSGPALFVGGAFNVAGGVPVTNLARWDGTSWSAVGNTAGVTNCMLIYDDGSGDALYLLGSDFQRWDGSTLTTAGPDTTFFTLDAVVFDDGSGPTIFGCGDSSIFTNIRKWNGTSWPIVGGGTNDGVFALEVFDDGNGPALYAGGDFTLAGGNPVERIARWDGTSWSALGAPGTVPFSRVTELYAFDDGNGLALFAGGILDGTGQSGVYKWDGSSWTDVGATPSAFSSPTLLHTSFVSKFASFDDGSGPQLVVAGRFQRAGDAGAINVARWDGSEWSGLGGSTKSVGGQPFASVVFDDGNGPALFVGGRFVSAGDSALNSIGKYDGTSWSDVGGGLLDASFYGVADVHALEVFDDGTGEALYAGGQFTQAGSTTTSGVAKWDGTAWSAIGSGLLGRVRALAVFDDGFGPKLYAAGDMISVDHIARWNGSSWEPLGVGTSAQVFALEVFSTNGVPELYVGGEFLLAGGLGSARIAKWRGTWSNCSFGGGGQVLALEVFAGGTGVPHLYAAGSVGGVRRWNGSSWSVVTSGSWLVVHALRVLDDGSGSGPALYAGGSFLVGNGAPSDGLAKWDGTTWTGVGGGVEQRFSPYESATVKTFGVFDDDGDGRADLFLGGTFASVGESPSLVNASNFAKWKGCAGPGTAYCFGDAMATVDCPCAAPNLVPHPSGSAFGGCANSFNPHGAGLSATGAINPDTVTLFAHGQSPAGFCVFFKSSGIAPAGVAVLDGVSCASGALIRFGSQNAVNGTAKYPNVPLGHTIPLSDRGATPVGSGLTGHYQVVYRNTAANFCTGDTLNFSSAYRITWN